jgi:hypothetical protein
LASDGGALALICGRDEEPQPSVIACWRILVACACYKLQTCIVDSKKQALRGLKKIVDDAWERFMHKHPK